MHSLIRTLASLAAFALILAILGLTSSPAPAGPILSRLVGFVLGLALVLFLCWVAFGGSDPRAPHDTRSKRS